MYSYRAWKRRLKSVNNENKSSLYKSLTVLLEETNTETFNTLLSQFMEYWAEKEYDFIAYCNQYYAIRPAIDTKIS